jgi:hypothetical protein
MSVVEITIVVIVALLVIAVIAGGLLWWRHHSLRRRFGPEYDRAVSEHDGTLAAERELRARQKRHAKLELRPLDAATRERYATAWQQIQAEFVDAPDTAIGEADQLLNQLVADRGYATGDQDEKLGQLSVEHAQTLTAYRQAGEIYRRHQQGEATTEELRQALVHYRELFAELLGEQPVDRSNGHASESRNERSDQPAAGPADQSAAGPADQPAAGPADPADGKGDAADAKGGGRVRQATSSRNRRTRR